MSASQLEAETGLAATRIRMILMNPLYNGWIRRHRGRARRAAPHRGGRTPPVSDELWARVEEVRRAKTRGGGPKNWDRVDLLGGLLVCVCGRQLRNDGTFADGRHRKLHASPCEAWGRRARLGDQTWEAPVLAQVAGIALDDATMDSVVAALGSTQQPVEIDRARIERQIRELALEHAGGRLGDDTYLARLKALREQRDTIVERTGSRPTRPSRRRVAESPGRVLPDRRRTGGEGRPDARHLRADHGRGPRDRGFRLTPAAYAHGLALALPEKVAMARPTGVGRALATYEVPIEGRDEWLAAARRLA